MLKCSVVRFSIRIQLIFIKGACAGILQTLGGVHIDAVAAGIPDQTVGLFQQTLPQPLALGIRITAIPMISRRLAGLKVPRILIFR